MIPAFRAIRTALGDVQRLQDALSKVFNAIQTKQILDGRLIENVAIVTGTAKEIDHGLQKPVRGWIVIDKNAQATVWSTASDLPNRTLILNTSADVTVSLWIF